MTEFRGVFTVFGFKNTHYGHLCLDELQYHKWSVFVWTYGRYDGIIQKLVCGVRICQRLRCLCVSAVHWCVGVCVGIFVDRIGRDRDEVCRWRARG